MTIVISNDGEKEFLVKFGPAVLSYPHLWTPFRSKTPGQTGKYGAKLLLNRNDPDAKADALTIHKQIQEMCKANFKQSIPSDKLCLRDGKQLTEDLHDYFVVSASESIKPVVVDRKRNVVNEEDGADLFYPGAKVVAIIRLWAQDSKDWGRRINANLVSLQFHSHGTRLGGRARPNVDEIYDDISGEFDDDEYSGGPTGGNGLAHSEDDGFGDTDGL
jgi:Protein of unknown function (DUF2815)